MTDLAALRTERDALESAWRDAGARLKAHPKDATGLTLDSAKGPAWRADRAACDRAFAALQAFNRRHKKHIRALTEPRPALTAGDLRAAVALGLSAQGLEG